MTYIIVKAKDIPSWKTEYDEVATCEDIIINCDYITRMESFTNRPINFIGTGENPHSFLVLHMLDGKKFGIPDTTPIETNWDLIMCYHKKSTRIEL